MIKNQIDNLISRKNKNIKLIKNYEQQINKYSVEIHKKIFYSNCMLYIYFVRNAFRNNGKK